MDKEDLHPQDATEVMTLNTVPDVADNCIANVCSTFDEADEKDEIYTSEAKECYAIFAGKNANMGKGHSPYWNSSIESRLVEKQLQGGPASENFDHEGSINCPLCGRDISDLGIEQRQHHTNGCLDGEDFQLQDMNGNTRREERVHVDPGLVIDVSPVLQWLSSLGLEKYGDVFAKQEIDWNTLQSLNEEDLLSIGITAFGARKKILHALRKLRNGSEYASTTCYEQQSAFEYSKKRTCKTMKKNGLGLDVLNNPPAANKLITEFFSSSNPNKKISSPLPEQHNSSVKRTVSGHKNKATKNGAWHRKTKNVPAWCCIPGTPFRVDAFQYLRGDCSHWFLTHFHLDHYQGLTKSFCHGKIYCSSITSKLINLKLGIPVDRIEVLPLNQKINIDGVEVTCLDANHCPGSIIIIFEPPNGKAVLHTGDFRFCDAHASSSILLGRQIDTLILDTTYCSPQYDFPKQEAVMQFVIEAIQAEAFNPKTLFLIGSYTIGKEKIFLEVARVLQKKLYASLSKLNTLKCLGLSEEEMGWFTSNEEESHIHVVPMWTIASFKRVKQIADQHMGRYDLVVTFSPTGWSFGRTMKKSPGKRLQQGTIVRYEVPYSEHCSFSELRDFVKLVSPSNIIPSVNNNGPDSARSMITLLS